MKRILFLAAVLTLLSLSAQATITINLTAAKLFTANGTTPMPDNMLIQLIISTSDGLFTAPTATSFLGGSSDDIVQDSFGMNSGVTGVAGAGSRQSAITLGGNLTSGDLMILRWWPTLSVGATAPGANTPYGEFRTNATVDGSTINWAVPADGQLYSLNYKNASAGGSQTNASGAASFVTPVPEPGTFGFVIAGILGFGYRRRR